ncbi:MAG TPA: HNH endonuclease signature motif containing protein [Tepidisphaeraceae bacterium]|nr:HNH endonuclease signature motif containing protein [Tepidisphaeraceae bacterium]
MIEEFHDLDGRSYHRKFQSWRANHRKSHLLSFKTKNTANLHASHCRHLGSPSYEEPGVSLTSNRKVVGRTVRELLDWAKHQRVEVRDCKDCIESETSRTRTSRANPDPMTALTSDDFRRALKGVGSRITALQQQMLSAHYHAQDRTLSASEMSIAMGWRGFEASNAQYGRLGSLLGKRLGAEQFNIRTLVTMIRPRSVGNSDWLWVMRPQLAMALEALGSVGDGSRVWKELDVERFAGSPDGMVRQERLVQLRLGQAKFKQGLERKYGRRCMISGCLLMQVVEAAHIAPYCENADDSHDNGLLLRADIHILFDLNLIGIEPNSLQIRIHDRLQSSIYYDFHKQVLSCGDFRPRLACLEARWKEFLSISNETE